MPRFNSFKKNLFEYFTFTLNFIGAYYVQYYVPAKIPLIQNMTYEQSLLKVTDYAVQNNIPYKYALLKYPRSTYLVYICF